MTRRCIITGKSVMTGNNVSHSNRKTRRRFLPNLQSMTFISPILGKVNLKSISTNAVRTIEHNGGLDNYLLSTPNSRLSTDALQLKKRLKKQTASAAA